MRTFHRLADFLPLNLRVVNKVDELRNRVVQCFLEAMVPATTQPPDVDVGRAGGREGRQRKGEGEGEEGGRKERREEGRAGGRESKIKEGGVEKRGKERRRQSLGQQAKASAGGKSIHPPCDEGVLSSVSSSYSGIVEDCRGGKVRMGTEEDDNATSSSFFLFPKAP